jgi:hypothetical protein
MPKLNIAPIIVTITSNPNPTWYDMLKTIITIPIAIATGMKALIPNLKIRIRSLTIFTPKIWWGQTSGGRNKKRR